MARLEVFWTAEEMAYWLSEVVAQYELRLLVFRPYPNIDRPIWLVPPFAPDSLRNALKMFMAPAAEVERYIVRETRDVEQRLWGWLMISGGARYTEPISMLEKTELSGKAQANVIKWLGRQLLSSGSFRKGCQVLIAPTGTRSPAPSVFFSNAAESDRLRGVTWVLDRGTSQIRYQPEPS